MIEVIISNDPSTLGSDATREDLEQFADALAARVGEEFSIECRARLDSVTRSTVGATDGEYDLAAEAESWLREFERSGEWEALAYG